MQDIELYDIVRAVKHLSISDASNLNTRIVEHIKHLRKAECLMLKLTFAVGDTVTFFDARPIAGNVWRTGVITKLCVTNAKVSVQDTTWTVPFNRIKLNHNPH
jgi:hypothetical protein